MERKDIKETLKAANEYLSLLKNLQTQLNYAEQQITKTTLNTESKIASIFENLIESLTTTLLNRRNELINEAKTIKQNALVPLQESQILILNKIKKTITLVAQGNKLLNEDYTQPEVEEFNQNSSALGSLPEVPSLKEVPYLSFQHCSVDEGRLIDLCKNFGSVMRIAPVQISTLVERPGAILIDWTVSETEDRSVEKYHLQKAFGEIDSNHTYETFHTCYIGCDTQYLVKDLNLNQNYTFRVCCKFEGEEKWSPWSLPQIGKSSIKSFSWETNEHFMLSNEKKIASPLNTCSMLYSKEIEFNVGYSVEFTFLECDHDNNGSFIGLFTSNERKEFVLKDASICFETNGNIYGFGVKKAMQFSPVVKGSKIYFTCNHKDKDKLRIDLDSGNSRVTYDWSIGGTCIYIGVWLNSNKWKIMID